MMKTTEMGSSIESIDLKTQVNTINSLMRETNSERVARGRFLRPTHNSLLRTPYSKIFVDWLIVVDVPNRAQDIPIFNRFSIES